MRKTSFSLTCPSILFGLAVAMGAPGSVAFAQQPSAADVAQARELFNEGLRLRESGDTSGALEKLKVAHALGNTPITGLELAKTYELAGQLVEARETLLAIGRIAVKASETARSSAARSDAARRAEELRLRIPSLTVKIAGVTPSSVTVAIDQVSVPLEALEARPVNPGPHEVSATSTGGSVAHESIDLKEGESREVELTIKPVAVAVQPTPTRTPSQDPGTPEVPSAGQGGFSPVFYAGLGLAGAGLIAGSVTGGLALGKASAARQNCIGLSCNPTGYDDVNSGRTLGTISTVGFIAAGVGVVVGVIGLVISPHHDDAAAKGESISPLIGLGGNGIQGTF